MGLENFALGLAGPIGGVRVRPSWLELGFVATSESVSLRVGAKVGVSLKDGLGFEACIAGESKQVT